MTRDNRVVCEQVLQQVFKGESKLVSLLQDKRNNIKLLACTCLTNLNRTGMLKESQCDVKSTVIPTLVGLFDNESIHAHKAPLILGYLIKDDSNLQKVAADCGAIDKLAPYITCPNPTKMKENALICLASVCSLREDCRKMIIEASLLSAIVVGLQSPHEGIRAASCQCTRSLSRSVKALRTSLLEVEVDKHLFTLLEDPNPSVQVMATAIVCNIVLDFAPMKKSVLENGGIEKLIALVHSMDSTIRFNAVWAIKNLVYQASSEIKQTVMRNLTFNVFDQLLHDSDNGVQEQAVNMLRNIACNHILVM